MQTELLKGTLSTLILKLLHENGRMYGYELTQLVKTKTAGKVVLKEGSLYPTLHKLLDEGFITVEEEYIGKRVRRYYSTTAAGTAKANEQVNYVLQFFDMMEALLLPAEPMAEPVKTT